MLLFTLLIINRGRGEWQKWVRFYLGAMESRQNGEFLHSTRNPRAAESGGIECLYTRFPLHILLRAGNSVKLKKQIN